MANPHNHHGHNDHDHEHDDHHHHHHNHPGPSDTPFTDEQWDDSLHDHTLNLSRYEPHKMLHLPNNTDTWSLRFYDSNEDSPKLLREISGFEDLATANAAAIDAARKLNFPSKIPDKEVYITASTEKSHEHGMIKICVYLPDEEVGVIEVHNGFEKYIRSYQFQTDQELWRRAETGGEGWGEVEVEEVEERQWGVWVVEEGVERMVGVLWRERDARTLAENLAEDWIWRVRKEERLVELRGCSYETTGLEGGTEIGLVALGKAVKFVVKRWDRKHAVAGKGWLDAYLLANGERDINIVSPEVIPTLRRHVHYQHKQFTFEMIEQHGGHTEGAIPYYLEAEKWYKVLLMTQKNALGMHHADTLCTALSLGILYHHKENLKLAFVMYNLHYEGTSRNLGIDHPESLWSQENMARIYTDLKCMQPAIRHYQEVCSVRMRSLTMDHPLTRQAAHCFVDMSREAGELDDDEADKEGGGQQGEVQGDGQEGEGEWEDIETDEDEEIQEVDEDEVMGEA